jgi:hypothetical protein
MSACIAPALSQVIAGSQLSNENLEEVKRAAEKAGEKRGHMQK